MVLHYPRLYNGDIRDACWDASLVWELDHMVGSCSMASTLLGVQLRLAYIGDQLCG